MCVCVAQEDMQGCVLVVKYMGYQREYYVVNSPLMVVLSLHILHYRIAFSKLVCTLVTHTHHCSSMCMSNNTVDL